MIKLFILLTGIITCVVAQGQEEVFDKIFFSNSPVQGSYYYSEVVYNAPSWVKNSRKKLPVDSKTFFTPGNALELHYVSAPGGNWQAAVQYHRIRGIDNFKQATHLAFHLLAKAGTTAEQLPLVGVRLFDKPVFVSLQQYLPDFETGKWLLVKIPLQAIGNDAVKGTDQVLFKQHQADGKEHHVLIDDIEFIVDGQVAKSNIAPAITAARGYEKHVDISWQPVNDPAVKYIKVYRSGDGRSFYPVGIQYPFINRFADYTDTIGKTFYYKISFLDRNYRESPLSASVNAQTHSLADDELLNMVQEAHFRYYWEGAEKNSGLARENIPGRRNMIATGASGFGIMALLAGAERKFINRQQLAERFDRITAFLEKADKFHGVFPHFLDGPTGKVVPFFGQRDNGGDLVETAFLMQGLLCARQYFSGNTAQEKTIRDRINRIWQGIEWDWYRKTPDSKFLYWHWSPDKEWIINHKLIGWNETMITYILGICSPTHAIPASMYYSGWASQSEEAQRYRRSWGRTDDGSQYTNGNTYYGIPLPVGVSNGGPLFFIHYSFMGLDPNRVTDAYTNYFTNNRHIALINYRYCLENPEGHQGYGPGGWGLTASDGIKGYSADEPVPHADNGKLTPTGALSSFPYTPEQSMQALKNYYRQYGKFLWGAYGFKDAFSPEANWCSEIFMGLNQAPITAMIENYRSGLLWKLFMSCPEIQEGLKKLEMESSKMD